MAKIQPADLTALSLRGTEGLFKFVLDSIADLVVVSDLLLSPTYFNERGLRLLGLHSIKDFSDKDCTHLFFPEDIPYMSNTFFPLVLATGKFEKEIKIKHAITGEAITMMFSAVLLNNETGLAGGYAMVGKNIYRQDEAERKLLLPEELKEHNREKFEAAIAVVEGLVWTNTAQGEIINEQPAWAALTGQSYNEYKGFGWADAVHPEDKQPTIEAWNRAVKENSLFTFEHRLKVKDNSWREFTIRAIPIKNPDGSVREWVAVHTDITDKRRSENLLKESEQRFRLLADESPIFIFIIEADELATVNYWNKTWLTYTGQTKEEALGRAWTGIIHQDDMEIVMQYFKPAFHNRMPYVIPAVRVLRHDGVYRWHSFKGNPHFLANNDFGGYVGVGVDVHEQKMAEEALKEFTEQFTSMADNISQLAWMADEKGLVYWYNKRWYDYTGTTLEQMKGWGWELVHHPEHVNKVVEFVKEAWTINKPFELTFPLRSAAGEYKWFLTRAQPIANEEGKVIRWFGTNTDITEQRETQALLEYSKALLEAHNEASFDGLLLVDAKGKIISFNKRFIEIWNMPQDIVDAKNDEAALEFAMTQMVNPSQFIEKVTWLYEHPTETSTDELEFINGKIIERHGYPVVIEDGKNYAWSWTFRDITEIRKAEIELRKSEENFRQLAELLPDKISTADASGNATYFSKNWAEYSGVSLEELFKVGWSQLIHPDDIQAVEKSWMKAVDTGTNFEKEFRLKDKYGVFRWHLSRATSVKDEQGIIQKWIANITDIQKLKEEDQRKSDFIAMVSHELKTPVTSIKGYVQFLLHMLSQNATEPVTSLPLQYSLTRIDTQVLRLSRLITELLDLTKLETGKLDLQKELFDVEILVTQTVQDIRFTHTKHPINFHPLFTGKVFADKDRIEQVLINLINNAMKYSEAESPVDIYIRKQGDDSISISVKDHGIGIDEKEQGKIFERFYRSVGRSEQTYAGFGIGLFIAKDIIERHNGSISVHSKKGEGATFTFTLPLAK
jgi:PAS domain S-box-containing protein